MAATSMKLAGRVRLPVARLMVTTLSSNDWRITSSTRLIRTLYGDCEF